MGYKWLLLEQYSQFTLDVKLSWVLLLTPRTLSVLFFLMLPWNSVVNCDMTLTKVHIIGWPHHTSSIILYCDKWSFYASYVTWDFVSLSSFILWFSKSSEIRVQNAVVNVHVKIVWQLMLSGTITVFSVTYMCFISI